MATPSASRTPEVREVARKVRRQPTSDGAGVRMTRVIGSQFLDSFDPFLLLDEFRSDDLSRPATSRRSSLGPARVLVGSVGGVAGPVTDVATDPVYFDLHLEAGASYTAVLPANHNVFAYVYQGDAKIGAAATSIARGELALTTTGAALPVAAGPEGARLIVVGGRPLNEPVARYGPFVMNTADEIRQAFADYQAGRL
jgi:redox-sensitive bicupin YhaK (pirin superfamily)